MIGNAISKIILIVILTTLVGCEQQTDSPDWNKTIDKVSSGVINIQMDVPVSFDGKWNSSSYATGFIVDKTRGIILTNRHVVTPGPVTAKGILLNNEEIDIQPLYIDPIHDFGFYQYRPSDIKHIEPYEFKLTPDGAFVGQEIRIIGNDAGQKLSILDGTISRLDREAPNYGAGKYNDFNTYYYQASTDSTGGSSGSPVIDINGNVIALNAGSQSRSANAYYLPLHPVAHALEHLQSGEPIARGGLLWTLLPKPYSELKRLGLSEELEANYRTEYPETKGLMVVEKLLPNTPAADVLQLGDIVLAVNDTDIVDFYTLERLLDGAIGSTLKIDVLRMGEKLSFELQVSDLHSVTPDSYLTFDASVFHDLSYQQARHMEVPLKGVFVANATAGVRGSGIPSHSVITQFNDTQIENAAHFSELLAATSNNEKVHLRYFKQSKPKTSNYTLLEINRNWFAHKHCERDMTLGYWPCKEVSQTTSEAVDVKVQDFTPIIVPQHTGMEHALVDVKYTNPYSILGRSGHQSTSGTGLIVDKEKGWVVIDRSTVQSFLGEVKVVINNQLELQGKIEFVHPLHNLALVSYPVEQVGNLPVAEAKFSEKVLQANEPVIQMGLNYDGEIEYRATEVDIVQEPWLQGFKVPQFLESNIEVEFLINPNNSLDGVLLNQQGEVASLWATFTHADEKGSTAQYFSAGISADYIKEIIEYAQLQNPLYSLNINTTQIAPVRALQRGLPRDWLTRIQNGENGQNKLLMIYQIMADTHSQDVFKRGDILLEINGQTVSSFKQLEKLSQAESLSVTFFREGKVVETQVATNSLPGRDIERVFFWAGLSLHVPHRAARMQSNIGEKGIYIASYKYGSPANRYKIYAMQNIVEVNGEEIKNSEDFIRMVSNGEQGESIRLKTKDFNDNERVHTLRIDQNYWPFHEVRYLDGKWQQIRY